MINLASSESNSDQDLIGEIHKAIRPRDAQSTAEFPTDMNNAQGQDPSTVNIRLDPSSNGKYGPGDIGEKGMYATCCTIQTTTLATAGGATGSSLTWQPLIIYSEPRLGPSIYQTTTTDGVPITALTMMNTNMWPNGLSFLETTPMLGGANTVTDFYLFHKHRLGMCQMIIKDWQFIVERTMSGGIQFKDEPIFELCAISPNLSGTAGGILSQAQQGPITRFTSKEPFIWEWTPQQPRRWFTTDELFPPGTTSQDPAAVKFLTAPGTSQALFYSEGRNNTADSADYLYIPEGPSVIGFAVRCINIPIGLTNVEIRLSYNVEWRGFWRNYQRVIVNPTVYAPVNLTSALNTLEGIDKMYSDTESRIQIDDIRSPTSPKRKADDSDNNVDVMNSLRKLNEAGNATYKFVRSKNHKYVVPIDQSEALLKGALPNGLYLIRVPK